MEKEQKIYYRLDDLAARFCCCKRSIYRWMKLENNPFPQPKISRANMSPLWLVADVEAWENL